MVYLLVYWLQVRFSFLCLRKEEASTSTLRELQQSTCPLGKCCCSELTSPMVVSLQGCQVVKCGRPSMDTWTPSMSQDNRGCLTIIKTDSITLQRSIYSFTISVTTSRLYWTGAKMPKT